MRLTPKQERFCTEYHKSGNGYQSYRTAFDTATDNRATVEQSVNDLLKSPKIILRLDELASLQEERAIITVDEILREMKTIAFNPDTKDCDRIRALELMGKHLGMFVDIKKLRDMIEQSLEGLSQEELKLIGGVE